MNVSRTKLLKLTEQKNKWEKEKVFLISKIYVLNENQLILEKYKEDKNKKEEERKALEKKIKSTKNLACMHMYTE